MINEIQEHYNNEEIEIIRLQNEIDQWISELKFVVQEINFFIELLDSIVIQNSEASVNSTNFYLNRFHNRVCNISN